MPPKLEAKAGIYVVQWDTGLIATLDRFHENSKSAVTAELTLRSPVEGVLHSHATFNLTSTTARRTLARTLETRQPGDWYAAIEEMCILVLDKYREGEPVLELGTVPPRPAGAPRYRLWPLLLEKQPTLLIGEGGHGKGQVACLAATLVSLPLDALGFRAEPGTVLYLDYEDDAEELGSRVTALQKGFGYESESSVLYRRCFRPFIEDLHELQKLCLEHKVDLLVVDSIGAASGSDDLNKEGAVMAFYRGIRSLEVTSFLIHHLNREKEMYGNVYIWNHPRSVWLLKRSASADKNVLSVGLFHKKANRGELHSTPIGLQFTWAGDAVTVQRTDVLDIPDLAEGVTLRQRIISVLRSGLVEFGDLALQLGMSEDKEKARLRATLHKYKNAFVQITGKWGLLSQKEAI